MTVTFLAIHSRANTKFTQKFGHQRIKGISLPGRPADNDITSIKRQNVGQLGLVPRLEPDVLII
jgi:hypothetical protein